MSDGCEVIVSHEPTFAGGTPKEPTTLTDRDSFMITSRRHNKSIALAHLRNDRVRTIRRKRRDGTIKSRVVTETLWYRDSDSRLESSDVVHV